MNICYIDKNCKWRGPYDVQNSSYENVIGIGDVCIRNMGTVLTVVVVTSPFNKWSSCNNILVQNNDCHFIEGNHILFSFDGLQKREGEINNLKKFADFFDDGIMKSFLQNAVDILEYKVDLWQCNILGELYSGTDNRIQNIGGDKQNSEIDDVITKNLPAYFISYFDEKTKSLILKDYNKGEELKFIYQKLRNENRKVFRKALNAFLIDYPNASIYDVNPQ